MPKSKEQDQNEKYEEAVARGWRSSEKSIRLRTIAEVEELLAIAIVVARDNLGSTKAEVVIGVAQLLEQAHDRRE